jgi:hypothetical protein
MNTYDDNLRESLTSSLGALADRQTALLHGQSQAEAGLYHAKGAVLAAQDHLGLDQRHRDERRTVHHAARRAHSQSVALSGTLALAKQGSDGAITNAATTAKNLQASADALMQLAATVGAALNVANAAVYDTELYHQLSRVNGQLNRIANQARFLALKGTEISSKCAESIVGALVDQGADVQTRLNDLGDQTQAALAEKVAAVAGDETALAEALAAEFSAHTLLREARVQQETMTAMLDNARCHANLDLRVEVLSARKAKVTFSAFKAPVGQGDRPLPPPVDARTFLAIVPETLADQFTGDRAAQLYSKWDGQPGTFTAVTPGENLVALTRDVDGAALSGDSAYAAFLYIEPSVEYKRYLGSFGDYLSLASAPFVPQTPLPAPIYVGTVPAPAGEKAAAIVLAVADAGQAGGVTAALVADLEAGATRLETLVTWLHQHGSTLPTALALRLDAVAPPFDTALRSILAALKDGNQAAAAGDAASLRDLLPILEQSPEPEEPVAEVSALHRLLPELGELVARLYPPDGPATDAAQVLELRCILIDHAADADLADLARKGTLPPWFSLESAQIVAPANYTLARKLEAAPDGIKSPAALKGKPCLWFQVDPGAHGKDCFGNPLLPGHRYAPFILATRRGPGPAEWRDTLTLLDHVWHLA